VEYDKAILTVAKKFFYSIQQIGVFTSFFKPVKKINIPKEKFYPQPSSDSIVMDLQRLPKPLEARNLGLFLRQYMYQQEGWKVKNSLREGLIDYVREIYHKQLTKNQAREIIKKINLKQEFLENTPNTHQVYFQVGKKFNESLFKPLIENSQLLEL
jgi:16S rRNA A1518/A1519 N6-dimethyltransferase RsmA/KsgA/DIM1 with predicted DNA glycosylase/AP lyase activity